MAITYAYKIKDLKRNINTGVITFATYEITASDEINSNTSLFHTGFRPPKDEIIPFEEITEETVISWIKTMFTTLDENNNPANENERIALNALTAFVTFQQITSGVPW